MGRAFLDKGRMSDLMESIPVHIVVNQDVGLQGAAIYARRLALDTASSKVCSPVASGFIVEGATPISSCPSQNKRAIALTNVGGSVRHFSSREISKTDIIDDMNASGSGYGGESK